MSRSGINVGVWQKGYIVTGKKIGWAVLAAIGLAGLAAGVFAALPVLPPRALGAGDVGVLKVFAQVPSGPVRIRPGRGIRLLRPQHFAFHFESAGTGPRFVRVEVEHNGLRTVMHEQKLEAPINEYLRYVLELGETFPDEVMLTVVVESPHMMSAVSDFPVHLVGAATPYWETRTATATK